MLYGLVCRICGFGIVDMICFSVCKCVRICFRFLMLGCFEMITFRGPGFF